MQEETLKYLKTVTLLCVEDNKTTQMIYLSILEDLVGNIIFANNGVDGYSKYIDNTIDIIITDYEMPKLNGLELSKKIRILNKDIPIILASGIDSTDNIIDALRIGINNFIKKPTTADDLLSALEGSTKILLANNFLNTQKEKNSYNSYQEDLGFKKELNILRNDFYYQMMDSQNTSLVDFLYQPLDVMSGDAYTARRIDEHSTFYLMVDGMGKGLSASLTAMIITSFANHIIDSMIKHDHFDFALLINVTMKYIQPILLDEEALAIDYIEINNEDNMLYYAKFAMPVLLMETSDKEIIRVKSNNPPLCKWQDTFNIDSYDISDISKFLIYSDGIVENETKFDNRPYSDFIEEDFLHSFTREDLKKSFFDKATNQEDDLTLIYIHRFASRSIHIATKIFDSTLKQVDIADEWYESIWSKITNDTTEAYKAGVVFTELYMNAYEHGNLALDSATKHMLLEKDEYIDGLLQREADCDKKITVKVDRVEHNSLNYIITQITDEGEGFDTQILSEIFRNSATFNGRGVFVSRKNSLGIYYNSKGTTVLYLNKVEKI